MKITIFGSPKVKCKQTERGKVEDILLERKNSFYKFCLEKQYSFSAWCLENTYTFQGEMSGNVWKTKHRQLL